MSDVGERITASVMLADYAAQETGKLHVIGGGLQFLGFDPNMGVTAPFTVIVSLTSPTAITTDHPAVEIVLVDAGGDPVGLPGPAGPQVMRISQNVEMPEPALPGQSLPKGSINASATFVLHFATGLPIPPGLSYSWRVQIDHDVKATYPFFIPGPPQGPVLG